MLYMTSPGLIPLPVGNLYLLTTTFWYKITASVSVVCRENVHTVLYLQFKVTCFKTLYLGIYNFWELIYQSDLFKNYSA